MRIPFCKRHQSAKALLAQGAKDQDWIYCHETALQCMGLHFTYIIDDHIDVYAKEKGEFENVNYRIVDSFDNIDAVPFRGIWYTSFNQTFNDMLADPMYIGDAIFLEALAKYYYRHNQSFDCLCIKEENKEMFELVKGWAIDYPLDIGHNLG
jgi:hypothetical protein